MGLFIVSQSEMDAKLASETVLIYVHNVLKVPIAAARCKLGLVQSLSLALNIYNLDELEASSFEVEHRRDELDVVVVRKIRELLYGKLVLRKVIVQAHEAVDCVLWR